MSGRIIQFQAFAKKPLDDQESVYDIITLDSNGELRASHVFIKNMKSDGLGSTNNEINSTNPLIPADYWNSEDI